MTTLREAAQQALEALEDARTFTGAWPTGSKAITALRAALAQEQAEPVEPVAWECKAGGLKPLTQRQYDAQTAATKRHYTRIAPPQRKPLAEEEIGRIGITHQSLRQVIRVVKRAHGIKE